MRALSRAKGPYVVLKTIPNQPPMKGVADLLRSLPKEVIRNYPLLRTVAKGNFSGSAELLSLVPLYLRKALSDAGIRTLVVEDLHWLDQPSSNILSSALRRGTVTFLGTSRPVYSEERKADLSLAKHLVLPPLSRNHVKELIKKSLNAEPTEKLLSLVYDRSRGSPFLVREFLSFFREKNALKFLEDGFVDVEESVLKELPAGAYELVLASYDSLPPEEKLLLGIASCLGSDFSEEELRKLAPSSVKNFSLKEALRRGIISRSGSLYSFSHAIFREAIYSTLLNTKTIHRRIARIYAQEKRDPYLVALHYEKGGARRKAEEYWMASFQHLIDMGLVKEAERVIERVRDDFRQLMLRVQIDLHVGNVRKATKVLGTALQTRSRKKRIAVLKLLAQAQDMAGNYPEMRQALERLSSLQPYMTTEDYFYYLTGWGIYYDMTGDTEKALDHYRKSLYYAQTPDEKSSAYYNIGNVLYLQHKLKEAKDYFTKSLNAVEDHDSVNRAWPLLKLGEIAICTGKIEKGCDYVEEAFRRSYEGAMWFGTMLAVPPVLSVKIFRNAKEEAIEVWNSLKDMLLRTLPRPDSMLKHFYFAFYDLGATSQLSEVAEKLSKPALVECEAVVCLINGGGETSFDLARAMGIDLTEKNFYREVRRALTSPLSEKELEKFHPLALALASFSRKLNEKERQALESRLLRYATVPLGALLVKRILPHWLRGT